MTAPETTVGYLAPAEVAAELRCSDDVVLRAIARGDLAAFRYGRLVRVARADLDAFIATRSTPVGASLRDRRPTRRTA